MSRLQRSGESGAARKGRGLRAVHTRGTAAGVAAVIAAFAFGTVVRWLVPQDGSRLHGLRSRIAVLADAVSPRSSSTYLPGVDEQW